MQTDIKPELRNTRAGERANEILRKCVHCGFCLATCPTYQLLGDERDSPRGRIYLIKSLLEGDVDTAVANTHLDRCLTCRACETTCPSGVEYGQLLDIGRAELGKTKQQPGYYQRIVRFVLRKFLTNRILFRTSIWFGRLFQKFLPRTLQAKLGQASKHTLKQKCNERVYQTHNRNIILFQGCVQPTLTPDTNIDTKQILDRLGIHAIETEREVCCGAISHHLSATAEARHFMRRNIDAWWPLIEQGVEAIIITASGCGVMLKDYGTLLQDDADYAEKALQVSRLVCDVSEYISGLEIELLLKKSSKKYNVVAVSVMTWVLIMVIK